MSHNTHDDALNEVKKVVSGSSLVFWIFFGAAIIVTIFLTPSPSNWFTKSNNESENKSKEGIYPKPPYVDSVFTVYLKNTDSITLNNYIGYKLFSTTGGTSEKPIPYYRNNENGWKLYGNGQENLDDDPSFNVMLKGADSTTSTRIWYWYHKI